MKHYKLLMFITLFVIVTTTTSSCMAITLNDIKQDDNNAMYYKMSSDEIEILKHSLELLSIGDDKRKIVKILGNPSYETSISGKRLDSPVTGYILEYYIYKYDKNVVNNKLDRYVVLVLDKNYKLCEIISNYEGISGRK